MSDRGPQVQKAIDLLDGRWTLPILAELARGGRRYQDLYDALDGISYKMLTETLRRAERDGLITRHLDPGRIETATLYELMDLGRSLDAPLAAMAEWAERTGSRSKQPDSVGTGCGGRAAEGATAGERSRIGRSWGRLDAMCPLRQGGQRSLIPVVPAGSHRGPSGGDPAMQDGSDESQQPAASKTRA